MPGQDQMGTFRVTIQARLMGEGKLQPQVGLRVSWKELGRAMSALRDRQVNGKVVLAID